MKRFLLQLVCLCVVNLCVGACGGGGSSDDGEFQGAAQISLTVSPREIDTGDRTRITVDISEVDENDLVLKILYPFGLSYVPDSAFLIVDNVKVAVPPAFMIASEDDDGTYLVFFLAERFFSRSGEGELELFLAGDTDIEAGIIQSDVDVDDPLVDNQDEFSLEEPNFTSESEMSIVVTP